ncbi:alpha-1,6-mannosyl-glycoprotein 2-beta-N-acetylglucosaminyltransferase-like [Gigantopelta aegis]|uniref:alpha-1,6-mannosyl-glycoprotein 2-beta-N-acetylglucosaminyltransferase-like n=1 Tax=Gigantopelta aegis TaxID=1735272 RepID=UPI001B88D65D|nr:alpha-1,6-mannosyl-glycoprotein 2-beta-N-acetylglucosaminyltransferase-like [Gigantopelta aegis]
MTRHNRTHHDDDSLLEQRAEIPSHSYDVYIAENVKNNHKESTTHRKRGTFIPNWKDVETFHREVDFLNHQGFIHNQQTFTPRLTSESIVILVQVHNRPDQLQMQIDSFRKMRYINETLVIFSHDFYSQDVFDVLAKIDFCPYMQIFYPYAIQVYNNQFPGDDPKDCPRNLKKAEARQQKCNNAEYQDTYGHYREAQEATVKHHWLWKLQFIFENCSLLRNFEGIIFRIEDDYYLAEDTIYYLRKLDQQGRIRCPECKMYIMGQTTDYSRDEYQSGAAKKDYWLVGNGRGMALRKDFWKLFKYCKQSFCLFDDCNWDSTLMVVTATCIPGGLKMLKPLGSRVFHLGSCKGLHQHNACKTTDVLNKVLSILKRNQKYLFPEHVNIASDFPAFAKRTTPYGGWADIRDHEMCVKIFNNESLSTTELREIHQKLFTRSDQ